LVSAVSYGAAPLAEPYARSFGGGLLVGYGDAYTYANRLGLVTARSMTERIRIIPTNTPSPTLLITATPVMTETAPPIARPSATLVPPTPTFTPEPIMATVISRQAVNMRSGPSTDNDVLAALPSGTTVLVLGFNDDQSWVNARLDDGREGWISASLLDIQEAGSPANKRRRPAPRRQQIDGETSTPRPTRTATEGTQGTDEATAVPPTATRIPPTNTPTDTPRPTRTPSPTITPSPTQTWTPSPTPTNTPEPLPIVASNDPGYRDERWYAMNLGIIASALIITFGMVVNLLRGLLRRGRRR
jgi:uncharacterized protein YraI